MGVPKDQVVRNRQHIVETASRVFRERGVDGVGVADLMKEAGFTHGGFYNHFASKDALAAEACASVFCDAARSLEGALQAETDGASGAVQAMLDAYLLPAHRDQPGQACPFPTLATDAARQGEGMQAAYASGVAHYVEAIAAYFAREQGAEPMARTRAIGLLITLVGGLVLARGVGAADPTLSDEILAVGRSRLDAE